MEINKIIKESIQSLEAQTKVNLETNCLKPIVFIDNTNFKGNENPLAIVHLELFNAKDVIELKSFTNDSDAFNIANLLGDEAIYCVWGNDNLTEVKNKLIEFGYPVNNETIFFDVKTEANNFYQTDIETFEDTQKVIQYASESLDLIFSSKESVVYSLFLDMINNGYNNNMLFDTVKNLVNKNEVAYASNIHKGVDFRTAKSNIEFDKSELINLEMFVDVMSEYNKEIGAYLNDRLANTELSDVHRMILSEKATLCRVKNDTYTYTKALLNAYKNEEFETYRFYYKTLEMYTMIEDAFILSESIINEETPFSSFVCDLGSTFAMSTATFANTYMLRKNVMAKLFK